MNDASLRKEGYMQALKDFEEKLDNAKANDGNIDTGNGQFVALAHWDYALRDQINQLREEFE